MFTIDITPKKRTIINDVNQAVKKLYARYTISPSGLIIPKWSMKPTESGIHFSNIVDLKLWTDVVPVNESTIQIDTQTLYEHIRDSKKIIQKVYRDGDEIGFTNKAHEEWLLFANAISPARKDEILTDEYTTMITNLESASYVEITEEQVETLLNDDMISLECGEYRIRGLTRELFPYIRSKTAYIVLFEEFHDKKRADALFTMTISYEIENVRNYHRYPCIKY